jgi:hypothetical protein
MASAGIFDPLRKTIGEAKKVVDGAGHGLARCYNPARFRGRHPPPVLDRKASKSLDARIAQLVEQRIENPRVGGSNPPPGTIQPQTDLLYFIACLLDRGFAAGILRLT